MTTAREFPYVRYNPDVVGDPGVLLAPPYDVIDEEQRAALAARSPYQSVLLELPEGGDARAAGELLRRWIDDDVLELGEIGVAVVQQRYTGPDGVRRTRIGVVCEVEVCDFDAGRVLAHERTFDAPRAQRVELMEQTGANISPVFMLYHDDTRPLVDLLAPITDDEPDFTAHDEQGTQTAVWFVTDLATCDALRAAVADKPLMIADGHHRYTAAQEYLARSRSQAGRLSLVGGTDHDGPPATSTSGPAGVLAFVANSADPGICVFPTHRILRDADMRRLDEFVVGSGALRCEPCDDVHEAMRRLDQLDHPGFVVHEQQRTRIFSVPDPVDLELAAPDSAPAARALDVTALHALVLDGGALLADQGATVSYTRSLDEAIALVAEDAATVALLMRPVPVEAVHAVAEAGEVLPQKSTYFYPKVPTGVAFRLLG